MFFVYQILNLINGKIYIGKSNKPSKRWLAHKRIARVGKEKYPRLFSVIHAAITKYGSDNFSFNLIQSFSSEKDAYKAEEYWINFYNSRDIKFGYNISPGGHGAGSGKNSSNFGLKRNKSTINKLRESHLGEKNVNFARIFSKETINNMSAAQIGNQCGEKHGMSILTWENVYKIRKFYQEGISVKELSKLFNTHRSNIYSIIKNKTWIK